ncbi:MAG: YicC family protein [Desulfovibrionaceae bacterium]|nr:YicC family protein [Desulfovibrionaceae bacterium]
MLKSMTGFGRSLLEDSGISQAWEIRSVNGRSLDIKWRLPYPVRSLEPIWERLVRKNAIRGRLDISLTLSINREDIQPVRFNRELAEEMLAEISDFAEAINENFIPDLNRLISISSLWEDQALEPDDEISSLLEQGLAAALDDWNDSRAREARLLETDINSRIMRMQEWVNIIESRAPDIKHERFEQLHERINQILARHQLELEEGRFLQEIALLADRLDVSEELTRLNAHLELLRDLLKQGIDAGRRMDFAIQECFREITTCGNKIQDTQVQHLVVDFKNELEKCREQVQNLE